MKTNRKISWTLGMAVIAAASVVVGKEELEDKSYLHEWKSGMGEVAEDGNIVDLRKVDSALLMPGAIDWGRTHAAFFERRLRELKTPFISTYHRWLKNESFGATWLVIRTGGKPASIEFFVRGGDARFILLRGDCRIAELETVQQMEKALEGQLLEKVIHAVTGGREAREFRDYKWDLPMDSGSYTLLLLDSHTEDWGFIEVSGIQYQRK